MHRAADAVGCVRRTRRAAREILGDGAPLGVVQLGPLLPHLPDGERVDNRLGRPLPEGGHGRNAGIVAGVARRAVILEHPGADVARLRSSTRNGL